MTNSTSRLLFLLVVVLQGFHFTLPKAQKLSPEFRGQVSKRYISIYFFSVFLLKTLWPVTTELKASQFQNVQSGIGLFSIFSRTRTNWLWYWYCNMNGFALFSFRWKQGSSTPSMDAFRALGLESAATLSNRDMSISFLEFLTQALRPGIIGKTILKFSISVCRTIVNKFSRIDRSFKTLSRTCLGTKEGSDVNVPTFVFFQRNKFYCVFPSNRGVSYFFRA